MNNEVFKNIKVRNIVDLLEIIKMKPQDISFVEKKYSSFNNFFSETLTFLIELELVKKVGNKIFIKKFSNLRNKILSTLEKKNKVSEIISNYLTNFTKDSENKISYSPSYNENLKTSYIRNFLIDIKIIENKDDCIIFKGTENMIAKIDRPMTPEHLKKMLKDKERIGLKAENEIINYEKRKLKDLKIDLKVEHTSKNNVSAGYDIESYRISEKKIIKIFIEVKAVSIIDYEFHLSELEFLTALKIKECYYLYLLPVDYSKENNFNLDKLEIINNLDKQIFSNKKTWNIHNSNYRINKKNNS